MTTYHIVLRRDRQFPFAATQYLCCPGSEYTLCGLHLHLNHEATGDVVSAQRWTWPDLKNSTGICQPCLGHAHRLH